MARGCVVGRRLERPLRLLRGNLLVSNLSEEELAAAAEVVAMPFVAQRYYRKPKA